MSHGIRHIPWDGLLIWTVIAITMLIYVIMPYSSDDYWYLSDIRSCGLGEDGTIDLWRGLTGCWKLHMDTDNARLANIIGSALLLAPRWVQGVLTGMAFGVMMLTMTKLLDIHAYRLPAYTTLTALILVLPPWYDHMFTFIFAVNYIWGSAITTVVIWLFIRKKSLSVPAAMVAGLVLGAWHESFGWSMLCSFLCAFCYKHTLIRSDRIAISLGIVGGLAWLLMSKGMHSRGFGMIAITNWRMAKFLLPNVILLALWLTLILGRNTRRAASRLLPVICVAGSTAIAPLVLKVHLERCIFPSYVLCALGITCLLQGAVYTRITNKKLPKFIFATLYILIICHLATVCRYTFVIRDEYSYAIGEYSSTECRDGVVFADCMQSGDVSLLALGKPLYADFYEGWTCADLGRYYRKPDMRVIPTCLLAYDSADERGYALEGSTDLRIIDGNPGSADTASFPEGMHFAMVDFGHGYSLHKIYNIHFTGAAGKKYVLVHVQRKISDIMAQEVKGIIINE